ncbi:MAG: helix-turn-helix transcriptional regulator [Oscillospiraceae bacterium]|nr:helix-turn-helix transcriptional regulator [Oscillospiraceae bacterium]
MTKKFVDDIINLEVILTETIADRINHILKTKEVKKTELAKRLKISDSSVSTICSGKSNPSKQTIAMICREFNVNEEWLQNGKGEMFAINSGNALEVLAEERHLSKREKALIEKILNLKPELRQAFIDFIVDMADEFSDESTTEKPALLTSSVAEAEALYEKNLGFAPSKEVSASNTIDDMESIGKTKMA